MKPCVLGIPVSFILSWIIKTLYAYLSHNIVEWYAMHVFGRNRSVFPAVAVCPGFRMKLGMHRYRYQYRYRCRYFVKILVLVLVFELPIPSTDTTHQYFTASNWPGYADTKCDLLSYLSYHSLPD